MAVRIGQPAPRIEAVAYQRGKDGPVKINLEDYKGQWVVLFFYPLDFSPVCPIDMQRFAEEAKAFEKEKAAIIGASPDSMEAHRVFFSTDERLKDVHYPVIADRNQEVSRSFGVLIEEKGITHRGTFIIDPEGVVRYISISEPGIGRSVSETLRNLQALRTGKLCPAEWTPAKATIN